VREGFALSRECPHLRIEIWGTILWLNLDVGDPPHSSVLEYLKLLQASSCALPPLDLR
jgi:hypothetical protein